MEYNNRREVTVTENSYLLGSQQLEAIPQEVIAQKMSTRKIFCELIKTLPSIGVSAEEVIRVTTSVHMLPTNKYVNVLAPVAIASTFTLAKFIALCAMRYAERVHLNDEEREIIEQRLNKIFDFVNWLDALAGNFIIAYTFAIWVLGYFFPGVHWSPTVKLLSLYYACCLGASALFSAVHGVLAFDKVSNFFHRNLNKNLIQTIQTLDYGAIAMFSMFASTGIVPQAAEIVMVIIKQDEEVDDPLHQKDFTYFYVRLGFAVFTALALMPRLVYEFATRQNHKVSDFLMSVLANTVIVGFITLLADVLVKGIINKDIFTCAAYGALAILIPVLLLLSKIPPLQKAAFYTLTPSATSLAASRYRHTMDRQYSSRFGSPSGSDPIIIIEEEGPEGEDQQLDQGQSSSPEGGNQLRHRHYSTSQIIGHNFAQLFDGTQLNRGGSAPEISYQNT